MTTPDDRNLPRPTYPSLTTCARCSCMKPRDGYDLCVNCVHADTVATDLPERLADSGEWDGELFDRPTEADDRPPRWGWERLARIRKNDRPAEADLIARDMHLYGEAIVTDTGERVPPSVNARIVELEAEVTRLTAERNYWQELSYDGIDADTADLRAEVARLTRWKDEAYQVMGDWQKVWEALGRPGKLGASIAKESLAEVERLRSDAPDQKEDSDDD